jgi:hypothetical protein
MDCVIMTIIGRWRGTAITEKVIIECLITRPIELVFGKVLPQRLNGKIEIYIQWFLSDSKCDLIQGDYLG